MNPREPLKVDLLTWSEEMRLLPEWDAAGDILLLSGKSGLGIRYHAVIGSTVLINAAPSRAVTLVEIVFPLKAWPIVDAWDANIQAALSRPRGRTAIALPDEAPVHQEFPWPSVRVARTHRGDGGLVSWWESSRVLKALTLSESVTGLFHGNALVGLYISLPTVTANTGIHSERV